MAFRVDLTVRAIRDLRQLYRTINVENSDQAADWFNGLETTILNLNALPERGSVAPEDSTLRQIHYGSSRNLYRIIYSVDATFGCHSSTNPPRRPRCHTTTKMNLAF